MHKDFKKKNPLSVLTVDNTKEADTREAVEVKNEDKKSEVKVEKKRPGRPKTKTEATKTINIAVPVSTLEKIEIAKECYNRNLTEYINKLIERDLEQNLERYKEINEKLKQLNMV